ncbi:lipoprotein signal peptidase [Paucilactobacillus oligofermentans DSM 15707 = LMG 22743]|uniref:Lipoprotein signal peptidase n=1 Tax=Paucilactobacillus oligofermentans DSM 15707 = LMG 22743 TaxID=1423778 RepID=A0A0R1RCS2_9LACO|nr:signal peptidase II [Paucilactobacillus oligofermentans]KRL54864.1 lipoprotein signal peptidase [Paucilactobacillus oligofermentans DSM 15707 = LMG 22743]CUS26221.1 Signal peptidase II [Paucilactobacillus oligofermentans DSM 15707 = LMG 22743]
MPYYGLIIVLLVIGDQSLKYWITNNIQLGAVDTLIPGIISLTNLRNIGAAWSILEGQQWFFIVISIIAIGLILFFLWRYRNNWKFSWPLVLILAGTIGNFIDRIKMGYVVDMFQLDFINFPIFNIADMCLTVGVVLMIIAILFEDEVTKNE